MMQTSTPPRELRARDARPSYTDAGHSDDEELFVPAADEVDFATRVRTRHFPSTCVRELLGHQVTRKYFDANGFTQPILVTDSKGLNITAPSADFTVSDVLSVIGEPDRAVEVMQVSNQRESPGWTLKNWVEYYNTPAELRKQILNVISLEFSKTPLTRLVRAPRIARQVDWVNVWPSQRSRTRPRVQKYCLMSVANAYTDFHIDFGGTSVWYHVVQGEKVFFFCPPTQHNLDAYAKWTTSNNQSQVFFGDLADACYQVTLRPGNTMFIAPGWIHAVLTPKDSLVFGGNYLHSFGIRTQLAISDLEERTKVADKYRFPAFQTLHWHVANDYVRNKPEVSLQVHKGLEVLHARLQSWVKVKRHKANIPKEVGNPHAMLDSLEAYIASSRPVSAGVLKLKLVKEERDKNDLKVRLSMAPTPPASETSLRIKVRIGGQAASLGEPEPSEPESEASEPEPESEPESQHESDSSGLLSAGSDDSAGSDSEGDPYPSPKPVKRVVEASDPAQPKRPPPQLRRASSSGSQPTSVKQNIMNRLKKMAARRK